MRNLRQDHPKYRKTILEILLKSGVKQGFPLLLLFNIVFKTLVTIVRHEKELKGIKQERKKSNNSCFLTTSFF